MKKTIALAFTTIALVALGAAPASAANGLKANPNGNSLKITPGGNSLSAPTYTTAGRKWCDKPAGGSTNC